MGLNIISNISAAKSAVSEILLTTLTVIAIVWYVQYHWKRRRLYKMAAQRSGPPTLPIIGNGWQFMGSNTDTLNYIIYMCKTYESGFPVWLGQRLFFGIYEPKHLEVLMNSPHALTKEDLYKYTMSIVGTGIFSAPVTKWKRNRKIIMPTFNKKILNGFVEVFSEQSVILTQQLANEIGTGYFDVYSYFSKYSLDAICETAMGVKVDAQTTDSDFLESANKSMEIIFKRICTIWYHIDFIFNLTSLSKNLDICAEKIKTFTEVVVKHKKAEYRQLVRYGAKKPEAEIDERPTKRNSFLAQLIKLSEEGAHLTDDDLRDEVNTVMIAGSETTASVNSFTLILLGMHLHIQEKVYKEVINTIGKDRPVVCEDLPHFPYTEMVIKESMRIFPIGPLLVRAVTKDIKLGECIIPEGTSVGLCLIHTHRDPKIYPSPLEFNPLRFLPEECAKRHPYSYVPFSGGPRNCVGVKYAYMAMKTVIATVVRKYRITSNYNSVEEIKLKNDLVLKPVDGYPIKLELRE